MSDLVIERLYIVVHALDPNELSIMHNVGVNHKPYCGASLDGREWDIADHALTIGEGAWSCGDCILKSVEAMMAGKGQEDLPLGGIWAHE